MNRWRNYGLWVSILAFIPVLLNALGIKLLPENYEVIVNALLGVLVLAGVINDPTTENKGYFDDPEDKKSKE